MEPRLKFRGSPSQALRASALQPTPWPDTYISQWTYSASGSNRCPSAQKHTPLTRCPAHFLLEGVRARVLYPNPPCPGPSLMRGRGGRRSSEPQIPTQVGEQQCPDGSLICPIGHFWGLGSLRGREQESLHPHQGQISCCKQNFLPEGWSLTGPWRRNCPF